MKMGVWWMEGKAEQSTKERMIPRLTTGAVADCEAGKGKMQSRRNWGSLGYIV